MKPLQFILPQLPTLADEPPSGAGWVHEVKYDGYRTQLVVEGNRVRAFTRNGHDWSARYKAIVREAGGLGLSAAILDGEIITLNQQSLPDFAGLRSTITQQPERLVFVAFDLLHLEDKDLRSLPLLKRKNCCGGQSRRQWDGYSTASTSKKMVTRSSRRWRRWSLRAWCRNVPTAVIAAGQTRVG